MTAAVGPVGPVGPVDLIAGLFAGPGARDYLGEAVSVATHMLQSAAQAQAAGAPPALVAAALLHDVGHFGGLRWGTGVQQESAAGFLGDDSHEETGASWLGQWFPRGVTEPIRLHVPAKRYLCAVEPGYLDLLSPASVHTLAEQGGVMTPAEAAAFGSLPHAKAAVAVRRWDDAAKDPDAPVPTFDHFRPLLAGLIHS